MKSFDDEVKEGIPDTIPDGPIEDPLIPRAPKRRLRLDRTDQELALRNALRYFPAHLHEMLAEEFLFELQTFGRIYMLRYRPKHPIYARPIEAYPAQSTHAAAIMLMIQNNLDPAVAQHPYELITYGGNGAVFQNWAQYRLAMKYLSEMTDEQTLVMYSGHPLGLFPSHRDAPRVVVTNGMMIPNYSGVDDYERFNALGVTNFGQMTAGSYMYIGPQGIVHGTTITILGAGRLYLGLGTDETLAGKVYITAGLGGMSGAQAKAAVIAGAVCVVAEINREAAQKRHEQGWVDELYTDLETVVERMEAARSAKQAVSIAYVGNVVDLWEYLSVNEIKVDLGSDQTSLHLPYMGGYYPVGVDLNTANLMMKNDAPQFRQLVQASLRRQVRAINQLCEKGMHFWDYGNAFLLESKRAKAEILTPAGGFKYPSYVEDIMGPLCFDYGFGPFRWVCASGLASDLEVTDALAADALRILASKASDDVKRQYLDNLRWIESAGDNDMVVGSKARILYADDEGRRAIASAFNQAVKDGVLKGPIILGRDHHDVSGTDSPYRETADIRDGSQFCADMSVQNFVGDAFRGATWISLHNGGGVGWGEVINGGFGLVLDGTAESERKLQSMLHWDVNNGVARRAWARNPNAREAMKRAMALEPRLQVTLPHEVDYDLLEQAFQELDAFTLDTHNPINTVDLLIDDE